MEPRQSQSVRISLAFRSDFARILQTFGSHLAHIWLIFRSHFAHFRSLFLRSVDNIPQNLGAPDRRSRIISTDPDHVFHSRVVSLAGKLKNRITEDFEQLISEWIGQPVVYSAGFGARTYLRNATFAAHVDRFDTHIASAIINLDQQVEEDWPVVICDHEGNAHAIPLHAGQALLYESARLLHSRPHPLQGDFYTNFFIHFKPKHWEKLMVRPHAEQISPGLLRCLSFLLAILLIFSLISSQHFFSHFHFFPRFLTLMCHRRGTTWTRSSRS